MKTCAAVLKELNKPLEIWDLTIPRLSPGQVLVEVAFSGVCHSQLLEARGKRGQDPYLPHTLGHEGSGTVLEVGDGVAKVKPGDHVVLSWIKGSGSDVPRCAYQNGTKQVNSSAISTFMKHTVVSENRVTKLPAGVALREAALLGCAIPTGAGVVINTLRVRPTESIVVFGVGGIGLSAILAAEMLGAKPIVAVDINDSKLQQARDAGATHCINAGKEDPLNRIAEITGGKGMDYAVEAAGRRETMEWSFKSVRDEGGTCVLIGNLAKSEQISIDPFDLIKGKRIIGTWGGESDPDRDIPLYANHALYGKLKLNRLPVQVYRLGDVNQALDDLENAKLGRGLIDMESNAVPSPQKAEKELPIKST
jgi:S-(hydroxymethyl)glutathione dehydrogenase / alcohol dehydrogenase